jgi:aminoglycoside phosphotransferase (APT) family kinase protein
LTAHEAAGEEEQEIALPGGMGSGGAVVRVGDTVRRPVREWSASVAALLDHLARVGFDGAPRRLGLDALGREILTFIEGDVAVPPFPAWAATEELLVSVAALQRAMHHASRSFNVPAGAVWQQANLPPPTAAAIVCHNDLCIENVVTRDGRAVGFIDFDFAAPADPLIDIAIAARHWVPVRDPVDVDPEWAGIDQVARMGEFLDAHGLDRDARSGVAAELADFLDRALVSMRQRAESGLPMYAAAWAAGYPQQNRRSRAWLDANASRW